MNKIDLLNMLVDDAKRFREDAGYWHRNRHMHDIAQAPDQADVDAVLAGFINYVAMRQGIDLALYASDLSALLMGAARREHNNEVNSNGR